MLENYAKDKTVSEKLDGFIGGRVPKTLEENFKAHCKKNGLSVAEALRILLEHELRGEPVPSVPGPASVKPGPPIETIPAFKPKKPAVRKSSGSREYLSQFAVLDLNDLDGKGRPKKLLPCPLCGSWSSYSNFGRDHSKEHMNGAAPADFFQVHEEAAKKMKEDVLREGIYSDV